MMLYHVYQDDQRVISPASLSAKTTNFDTLAGVFAWSIAIPESLSAHPTLNVQTNFSNFYMSGHGPTNPIRFGLSVPLPANYPHEVTNPSFSANWITIGSITTGQTYFYTGMPARYVRLMGTVSADGIAGSASANFGSTAFSAYIWSTNHVIGV